MSQLKIQKKEERERERKRESACDRERERERKGECVRVGVCDNQMCMQESECG